MIKFYFDGRHDEFCQVFTRENISGGMHVTNSKK